MKALNHLILRASACALLVCSLLSFPLVVNAGNNISVRVICNGAWVANADVKLYRVEANGDTSVMNDSKTDKKGKAEIRNFKSGTYELRIVCSGQVITYKFFTGGGADFSHSYLFRCCPPGSPGGPNGLAGIDGNPATDAERANSTSTTKASVTTANGLQTIKFASDNGDVIVYLPDDMRAGDTISGTVVAEPKGQTEEERKKNMSVLSGYVIDIAPPKALEMTTRVRSNSSGTPAPEEILDFKVQTAINPITFKLPPTITPNPTLTTVSSSHSGWLGITLTNTSGSLNVGPTQTVPIEMVSLSLQSVVPITVQLTTIGQQGKPIEIIRSGGNSQSPTLNWTKARSTVQDFEKNTENVSGGFGLIGGNSIASSPRKAVFVCPTNVTGPVEITLKEGEKETKGTFRNVGVNLSAPKTNLLKGESTTLTVNVSGLQGITQSVPLHLVKDGVVSMQGGDAQTMSIKPAEVQNGTFTTTRTITGVQAGVWSATATVVVFDVCLQDDRNGNQLQFSSTTGDYTFCAGRSSRAGANPFSLTTIGSGNDSAQGGGNLSDPHLDTGHYLYKQGSIVAANFNYEFLSFHMKLDSYTHTGTATIQTTNPKRKFTITDRDTRNNTCLCSNEPGQPANGPAAQPTPQSGTNPTPSPATGTGTNPQTTPGPLDEQVVHVEGTPGGGNGLWLVKIKLPSGKIINIYIRSPNKPALQFCNWIKIKKSHDETGDTYVDSYEKTDAPKPPPTPTPTPKPTPVKPPATGTEGPGTTPGPPPCKDGTIRDRKEETKTFEFIDDDAQVDFGMDSTSAGGVNAALGMADFWKTAAKVVKGVTDRLPGGGGGAVAVGLLSDYLDKGGDILNAVAKGPLSRLNEGVSMQLTVTTYKVTVTCITFEICEHGKWVKKKVLVNPPPTKSIYRASRRAHLGDAERDKIEDSSRPQFLDPDKVDQWAKDFLKGELDKLKKAKLDYEEFVKNCK